MRAEGERDLRLRSGHYRHAGEFRKLHAAFAPEARALFATMANDYNSDNEITAIADA